MHDEMNKIGGKLLIVIIYGFPVVGKKGKLSTGTAVDFFYFPLFLNLGNCLSKRQYQFHSYRYNIYDMLYYM